MPAFLAWIFKSTKVDYGSESVKSPMHCSVATICLLARRGSVINHSIQILIISIYPSTQL
jgi:hypothetical protein